MNLAIKSYKYCYAANYINKRINFCGSKYHSKDNKNCEDAFTHSTIAQKQIDISENNYKKICKLFLENGTLIKDDIAEKQKELKILAAMDFKNIKQKYEIILDYYKKNNLEIKPEKYKEDIRFDNIKNILLFDELTPEDLQELILIKESRGLSNWIDDLKINELVKNIMDYEDFENIPIARQTELISIHRYVVPTSQTLSQMEIENIKDDFAINRFKYIKDIKKAKNREEFLNEMQNRRINIPCRALMVEKTKAELITSDRFIYNLSKALTKTNLTKYENGFPLKYPRNEFIQDFKNITDNMSAKDKIQLYKYFGFNINTNDDIIKYPNPIGNKKIDINNIHSEVEDARKLINKYIYQNSIKLDREDKDLEIALNLIITAFPEFISVIGKSQHRKGSIDFHTFDNLQRIMNNPEFYKLKPEEQRILYLATLFHDFAKAEGTEDPEHPKNSALIAKEIIKKLPISFDEKERIYNLIKHSHWLVDKESERTQGFYFRRPNDFKIAQIFSRADSNSAGFEYNPSKRRIDLIKENIDKINSDGILIFADNIPIDTSSFETNRYGVKYMDFRNPEASVEKYGYPKGTKVKDLKFFCHCSQDRTKELSVICDDSKDVCLSTMLLDKSSNFDTMYTYNSYIMSGNNANIVIGGKYTASTGYRRGLDYAKEGMYQSSNHIYFKDHNVEEERQRVPNFIRKNLDINKKEYLTLYNTICNYERLCDIPDVKLPSGRIIKSSEIKKVIKETNEFLTSKTNPGHRNEFVIYNPKIEAKVIDSKLRKIDEIKNSLVPIVLV